jgi:hypothetical protein
MAASIMKAVEKLVKALKAGRIPSGMAKPPSECICRNREPQVDVKKNRLSERFGLRRPAAISQWPQAVAQLVAAQEPQPDFPPAKADSILRIFADLQAGQTIFVFSSLERNSTSNSFLHFWHWNS